MSHLDDYIVRRATEEQWAETHKRQLPMWGKGMTLQQFVDRETTLCRKSRLGSSSFHAWVLVPRNNPESLDFPCSCESYERPVYYKDGSHQAVEGVCHSIASVFTAEQYRKKGFAQRMMSLLHDVFVEKGVIASVLYSDVGDFYSRCSRLPIALTGGEPSGWTVAGPMQAEWTVKAGVEAGSDQTARRLEEEDLDDIAAIDAKLFKHTVDSSETDALMCILPTGPGLEWRSLKSKFYEKKLKAQGKRDALPSLDESGWGVELGSRDDLGSWAYALWAYDLQENELIILRLRGNSADQLRTMISKALEAAGQQRLEKVTAWNLDEALARQAGGTLVTRTEHLPALAWYGKGSRPEWIANENWAWC